jgi:PAS domain S-box-containing protein
VDNDRLCAELLGDILCQEGYTVSKAFDGMEAMEVLQNELPDIVFLDLVMPKIDGDRLFQYIRNHPRTSHIPIVIVSGTLVEDAKDALAMKADAYVAKGRREEFQLNIKTTLQRLETGMPDTGREILGLANLIPRHKVKELLAVRRFSQTVLRTIVEGIVEVDGRQRILFVNRACLEMVGRPELELIGIPLADLLTVEHRETLTAAIADFLACPTASADPVTLRYRNLVLRVTFAWIIAGDPTHGFFMILRDVTDLARKIEELSELNEQLQAMDRMRSDLLTMVSHDLHTPLTAIKGSLEVLLYEAVGVELRHELLGIAQKNVDRLFRLVSDILDLARIEAGRFKGRRERFDIVTSLRGTLDRLRQLAHERDITMSLEAPEEAVTVFADGVRMEQVFTNLLGNALKFTPRGGRIHVVAQEQDVDVVVSVTDTGVGIPPEHLDRVFDRFYRVPLPAASAAEGTGLGLSICQAVVQEHGGRIWVESHVGRGSTFFVAIPKAGAHEGTVPADAAGS